MFYYSIEVNMKKYIIGIISLFSLCFNTANAMNEKNNNELESFHNFYLTHKNKKDYDIKKVYPKYKETKENRISFERNYNDYYINTRTGDSSILYYTVVLNKTCNNNYLEKISNLHIYKAYNKVFSKENILKKQNKQATIYFSCENKKTIVEFQPRISYNK